ncbi:MarR family winged helix-turn-helix transcriptional regulator [Streptomyces sp. NPDC101393]|uniref:MarR family winged helix-turn-helix transcriptional regulator n=2 Tax=Streptomyces TaxID=1883 RepID=UPI00381B41DF
MPDPARAQDPIVALQRVLATLSYLVTRSQSHERQAALAGVKAGRSDLYLLMALDSKGGGSRVGDLAALLMVEPSHVTRQIGQLAAQDLVERTPDPQDRRARQVAITPRGKAVLERLQEAGRAILHQALDDVGDADIATTVTVLNRLVDKARAVGTHDPEQAGAGPEQA